MQKQINLEEIVRQMLPEHETPEISVGSEVGEEIVEYEETDIKPL